MDCPRENHLQRPRDCQSTELPIHRRSGSQRLRWKKQSIRTISLVGTPAERQDGGRPRRLVDGGVAGRWVPALDSSARIPTSAPVRMVRALTADRGLQLGIDLAGARRGPAVGDPRTPLALGKVPPCGSGVRSARRFPTRFGGRDQTPRLLYAMAGRSQPRSRHERGANAEKTWSPITQHRADNSRRSSDPPLGRERLRRRGYLATGPPRAPSGNPREGRRHGP